MNDNALLSQLDDFNASARDKALESLAAEARKGRMQRVLRKGWTNMHCHTFFSFNAYGYSPSRLAWEGWHTGWEAGGIVDFDCLDGTEEFLDAGKLLRFKTCAGLETRVFVPQYADVVINSPNEPGVFYISGTGFITPPPPGTPPAGVLDSMRERARRRNIAMMERINAHLGEAAIDYERDVLTRTPAGNATERHMLSAYEDKARERFPAPRDLCAFWADRLDEPPEIIAEAVENPSALQSMIRKKLMKHGGPGYARPDSSSFPVIDDVVDMIRQCGAIPSACWLDGSSKGEQDPLRHLEFLRGKGCESVSVIPDRNWNVPQEQRGWKVKNLNKLMEAGEKLDMTFLAGTEMNKDGNRLIDDFDAPALAPHRETFRKGALIAWGHTLLMMCAGVGLCGDWSDAHFGPDRRAKNAFFARVGEQPYPTVKVMDALAEMDAGADPDEFLKVLAR